jgi:hypothetical protein
VPPKRAQYREFAIQGLTTGLAWGASYVALSRYIAREVRSLPEIAGLILGHGLMFGAVGVLLALAINWASERVNAGK